MGRRPAALALTLAAVCGAAVAVAAQQQPTFRGGTNLITVDVSVRKGNVPVTGLTAKDFVVTDNGVRQDVTSVAVEHLPVNVTLLLDTSGSVGSIIDSFKAQVRDAAALLTDSDRMRLLIFAADATQVFPMQSPRDPVNLDDVKADGLGTSLYDALAAALIRQRQPDRGELVVAFSDGIDTTSAMSISRLKEVASRSEAVLHAFVVRTPALVQLCMGGPRQEGMPWLCNQTDLKRIAETTGGRMHETQPRHDVPEGLKRALDEFRTSYTVRYTATGVARPGWHDINVTVATAQARDYTIRARRGYTGG